MSSELRGCPFCGGQPVVDASYQVGLYYGCRGCEVWRLGADAWNRRATMELSDSEVGDLLGVMRRAEAEFWGNGATGIDWHKTKDNMVAKAARKWLAERSGG